MKDYEKVKHFEILSGMWLTEDLTYRWSIRTTVYGSGGFKAKGRLRLWIVKNTPQSYRNRGRHRDWMWFVYHLGKEFMNGKQVHHDWDNGEVCYVLSKDAHVNLHRRLRA